MRRLSEALLRHPGRVLLGVLAATLGLALGIPRLETDVGYRAFLGPTHEAVRTLDDFLARFGGGLPLRAVWSCAESSACENALDEASLTMADSVARALERSPAVTRVVHPGNATLLVQSLDGLEPRRLQEDGRRVADADALASRALGDPTWVGELVSADGRVGSIVIELASSASDVASRGYADLDAALAPFESDGFRFHRVGGPVEFVVAGRELDDAMARIVPVMVGLVAIGLLCLLRSAAATAIALATVGVAVVWTLGFLGWVGWARNSLTQTLPPLVLVIGVCDGIHLISRYRARCAGSAPQDRQARRDRLARAISEVLGPCAMTTITTAVGFASFTTASLDSFVQFGVTSAFGVCAALVLSFSLLPALLVQVPASWIAHTPGTETWSWLLEHLSRVSRRHAGAVLSLAALLGLLGIAGFARLRVDSSFEDLYGEDSAVVRWARFTGEHLSPPDRLEIDLSLPPDLGIGSEQVREVVADVGQQVAMAGTLGPPRSFLSRPHWRQELLAASAGRTSSLDPWVDLNGRHVRISLATEKLPQEVMREVMRHTRSALDDLPAGFSGVATGPFAVVNDMVDAIRRAQLSSFGAAALAISLLLWVYLRSLPWALLAMLPTLLPVVVTLGVMGLSGIALDIGSAMVAAVVLGVAVDDAIHLLDRFRRHALAGAGPADAIGRAIRDVGQPLISTSVALAFGFSALALSPWHTVASFGLVSGVAILSALAAVLLVLPALVCAVGGEGESIAGRLAPRGTISL